MKFSIHPYRRAREKKRNIEYAGNPDPGKRETRNLPFSWKTEMRCSDRRRFDYRRFGPSRWTRGTKHNNVVKKRWKRTENWYIEGSSIGDWDNRRRNKKERRKWERKGEKKREAENSGNVPEWESGSMHLHRSLSSSSSSASLLRLLCGRVATRREPVYRRQDNARTVYATWTRRGKRGQGRSQRFESPPRCRAFCQFHSSAASIFFLLPARPSIRMSLLPPFFCGRRILEPGEYHL